LASFLQLFQQSIKRNAMPEFQQTTRFGFHYFPDTVHYRQTDLSNWLPELKRLRASWLTMIASPARAIPEFFVSGLLAESIQPVIHFPLSVLPSPKSDEIGLLFDNYARWGVRFIALFDRPNLRLFWPAAAWLGQNLVERFLDIYIPLANRSLQAGLVPIFPPLEPGGDYWDLAFLHAALLGMQRRQQNELLDHMIIGAYAWAGNKPLNWGAGGPERWPDARPYEIDDSKQDHRGFRIFDWYQAVTQAVLGRPLPIVLLRAGCRIGDNTYPYSQSVDQSAHTRINLTLAQAASAQNPKDIPSGVEPLPRNVLACNFWLLSTSPLSQFKEHAWFQPDGGHLPVIDALDNWLAGIQPTPIAKSISTYEMSRLSHYLLLPSFEWGVSDWHLEAIRPFIKKYRPAVGFSVDEAKHARRVTLVGEYGAFSDEVTDQLIQAGCIVEQVQGSGTELASKLAEL
jgi:hypothetical protein